VLYSGTLNKSACEAKARSMRLKKAPVAPNLEPVERFVPQRRTVVSNSVIALKCFAAVWKILFTRQNILFPLSFAEYLQCRIEREFVLFQREATPCNVPTPILRTVLRKNLSKPPLNAYFSNSRMRAVDFRSALPGKTKLSGCTKFFDAPCRPSLFADGLDDTYTLHYLRQAQLLESARTRSNYVGLNGLMQPKPIAKIENQGSILCRSLNLHRNEIEQQSDLLRKKLKSRLDNWTRRNYGN
jgi:hypothetical protein